MRLLSQVFVLNDLRNSFMDLSTVFNTIPDVRYVRLMKLIFYQIVGKERNNLMFQLNIRKTLYI